MYFVATFTAELYGEKVTVSTHINPELATCPDYKEFIRRDLKLKLGQAIVEHLEAQGRTVYREEKVSP